MNSFDRIIVDVDSKPTIDTSTIQLLHNIASEIRVSAGNADASQQLADLIEREAPRLAAHVMANTPMIVATPPVHPSPAAAGGSPDKLAVTSMTGTPEEVAAWAAERADLHEIDREKHADGRVTVYFRPVQHAA